MASRPSGGPVREARLPPVGPGVQGEIAESGIRAWVRTGPGRERPHEVELVHARGEGSWVFRFHGVPGRQGALIAKRLMGESGRTERTVYGEILSRLPVPAPTFLGGQNDDSDPFVWIFLEDVGGRQPDRHNPGFAALATEWLVTLHTALPSIRLPDSLPDRGPDHYRGWLGTAQAKVRSAMDHSAGSSRDGRVLAEVAGTLARIEARWHKVGEVSARFPSTLVHGDWVTKNMRVKAQRETHTLFPLDWENAGRGAPIPDLWRVDPGAYYRGMQTTWADLDLETVRLSRTLGRLFRDVKLVAWECAELGREGRSSRIQTHLSAYDGWLKDSLTSLGW